MVQKLKERVFCQHFIWNTLLLVVVKALNIRRAFAIWKTGTVLASGRYIFGGLAATEQEPYICGLSYNK